MSAVITPFQGTEPFNTTSFNNRISQINTGFSYVSNPNLLDNWYFANPINQRGQSEYTGAGYTVDRWWFDNDSHADTISLTNAGIKFSAAASATGIASLKQVIEPTMLSVFAGKTVTLSLLGKTDKTQQVLFYVESQIAAANSSVAVNGVCMTTLTYTFPDVLTSAAIFIYGRTAVGAGEGTILAAKLELGSTQTLAHQENGQWVLNEIPEYGEQLRRCWRYYINSSTLGVGETAAQRRPIWPIKNTSIHYCSGAQFPVVMRITPAVTIYSAVNGTKNAVSNALNGADSPATASVSFVGSAGFHQVNLLGEDAALDQTVACFTYVASADL